MSFDIPASMEPRIQEYAHAQHISEAEAIVQLLEAGLDASPENYSHIFTPERIRELDRISREVKSGGDTYTLDQARAHIAAKK